MKSVVYTVLSGGYDKIRDIRIIDDEIDYVVISDRIIELPPAWSLRLIDNTFNDPILYNRYYKINPHIIFSDYDRSIYIDSNIQVVGSLNNFFEHCSKENGLVAMYDHPVRNCAYEEAEEIKRIGYAYFYKLNKQMHKYKKEGYHDLFLKEANIIYRRHNLEQVIRFSKVWWNEFSTGVKRDQLSLSYACLKTGCPILSLGNHDARFGNNYFKYNEHLKRNRSRNLKARLINNLSKKIKID